jgi:two-component sensor histidine kinase
LTTRIRNLKMKSPKKTSIPSADLMKIQIEKEKAIKKIRHELINHLSTIHSSISILDFVQSNYVNKNSTNKYFRQLDEQINLISEKVNKLKMLI